jgi:GntR family transcriptional regulator
MQIHIAPGDELPIYRQIMRQITDAIAGSRLKPGEKLLSQRDLAEKLVISHLTVKKAYEELERQGLIQTIRGRGTFVSRQAPAMAPEEKRSRLRETMRRLLQQAHLSDVPFNEVLILLQEMKATLDEERKKSAHDEEV